METATRLCEGDGAGRNGKNSAQRLHESEGCDVGLTWSRHSAFWGSSQITRSTRPTTTPRKGFGMVKKTAFGISATVTFVIAAAAIWLLVGGGEVLAKSLIINPHYDRRVSQFQQLPVRAGDTVFLGVVKITDATSDVEHARPGEVADLARISKGLCWDARLPQPSARGSGPRRATSRL